MKKMVRATALASPDRPNTVEVMAEKIMWMQLQSESFSGLSAEAGALSCRASHFTPMVPFIQSGQRTVRHSENTCPDQN